MSLFTLKRCNFACQDNIHLFVHCGIETPLIELYQSDAGRNWHCARLVCPRCEADWYLCLTCEDIRRQWPKHSMQNHKCSCHPAAALPDGADDDEDPDDGGGDDLGAEDDGRVTENVRDLSYLPDADDSMEQSLPSNQIYAGWDDLHDHGVDPTMNGDEFSFQAIFPSHHSGRSTTWGRNPNAAYFQHEYENGRGSGARAVVKLAVHRGNDQFSLSLHEVVWGLVLRMAVNEVPASIQEYLLYLVNNVPCDADGELSPIVPSDVNRLRSMIFEGKHSMNYNSPMPPLQSLPSGFVYISLLDNMAHRKATCGAWLFWCDVN